MTPSTEDYEAWHAERLRGAPDARTEPIDEWFEYNAWHQFAEHHAGNVRGLRVLEIGCGMGEFSYKLAKQGATVVAADFFETAVGAARTALAKFPNAQVIRADIQDIPEPDNSFDMVISLETLEHVNDPKRAIGELVRVTRAGGRLIITGPNYLSLMGLSRILLRLVGRRYHEVNQPINKPVMLPLQLHRLREFGCHIDVTQADTHLFVLPGFDTFRLGFLERLRTLDRFGYQTGIVATKLPLN